MAKTTFKKTYLMPATQVLDADPCYVLAASGNDAERYNYLCPHMPEIRCREYNRSMRRKHGIFSLPSKTPDYNRISVKGREDCPKKASCKIYKRYCELTHGRQH